MKNLIIFEIDNQISLITNSSSELFVLNGENRKVVENLINEIHPDYTTEYEPVICLQNASTEQIETYLDSVYLNPYSGFYHGSRDYEKEQDDLNKKLSNKVNIPYDELFEETSWGYVRLKEDKLKKIAKKLDPNKKIFLLFSIDENPNWDYQEKLMNIGSRYHLG